MKEVKLEPFLGLLKQLHPRQILPTTSLPSKGKLDFCTIVMLGILHTKAEDQKLFSAFPLGCKYPRLIYLDLP